jgi:hypothetical protein
MTVFTYLSLALHPWNIHADVQVDPRNERMYTKKKGFSGDYRKNAGRHHRIARGAEPHRLERAPRATF